MGQIKVEGESNRRAEYQLVAEQSAYRLETCLEELQLAIKELRQCAKDPWRKLLIAANASVDVVASISRSIEGQMDACLARTAE